MKVNLLIFVMLAEFNAMPYETELDEIESPTRGAELYRVRSNRPGGTGYATGCLSVPEKPGRYMAMGLT